MGNSLGDALQAVRREGVLCYEVAAGVESSAGRGALSALLCASSAGKPPASAKRVSSWLAGWLPGKLESNNNDTAK